MEKNEILYDHYKDTVSNTKAEETKRNKLFIVILLHITILFLLLNNPDDIYNTISELLENALNIKLYFSLNVIRIVLMISVLYCTMRYFQINNHIDRTYKYISKIEDCISKNVQEPIEREGKNYLKDYPILLDIIYWGYKYLFPVLYIIAIWIFVILNKTVGLVKVFEVIITLAITIINIFYIYGNVRLEYK